MFKLIILYLPSLIGLIIINYQFIKLLKIAHDMKSVATSFLLGIFFAMVALLISWFVVLAIGYSLIADGASILSWQVAWLPVGWAIATAIIIKLIR